MSPLLHHAEEILETALIGSTDVAIVIGGQGSVRMINPAGWSLPAMRTEFGAAAVYKVERRGSTVRVEGWDGERSCRLEKCVMAAKRPSWPLHDPLGGRLVITSAGEDRREPALIFASEARLREFEIDHFAILGDPPAAH